MSPIVARLWLLLWAGLASASWSPAAQSDDCFERFCPEQPIPVFPSASAQLGYARQLKQKRHASSGEERDHWGLRAVDAYREVRLRFPEAKQLAQEALFRSGRLLAVMGREDAALCDFFLVAGQASVFGLRARMEIGHLYRQRLQWGSALEHYASVSNDEHVALEWRARARLLAGDMCMEMGMWKAAEQAWLAVANGNCDRRNSVLAFDRIWRKENGEVDQQRLSMTLLECLESLGEVVLEETCEGRRVRRALQRTRMVKTLAEHAKKRS